MKRKIIIVVVAIALVAAITGTCFAMYQQNAGTRRISLSIGDSISLSFDEVSDNFSLTQLRPGHDVTLDVTLDATHTDLATEGMSGKFTVSISGSCASLVTVSATGTDKNSHAVNYNHAALTAGQTIDLDDIPTDLVLTFSMESMTSASAEQTLTVTLSWIIDTTTVWPVDGDAHYVLGTYNGSTKWDVNSDCWVLTETPNEGDCAKGTFTFAVGDKIKCVKGDIAYWYAWQDDPADKPFHYDDDNNLVIDVAGSYTIFLKEENYQNKAYIQKNA